MTNSSEEDSLIVLRQCFSESSSESVSPSRARDCVVERLTVAGENLVSDHEGSPTSSTDANLSETGGLCFMLRTSDGQFDQSSIGFQLMRSTCFHTYDPCESSTSVGIQWDTSWARRHFIASLHLYSLAGPSDEIDSVPYSDTVFNSEDEACWTTLFIC